MFASGARTIVFAGGDPSIRPTIESEIDRALDLGLFVEVQTNAHALKPSFLAKLRQCHLVGVSLDGPSSETHDAFRNKAGNFERVIQLVRFLEKAGVPVVLRSVVALPNYSHIPDLVPLVESMSNVVRWSLLEFSPFGGGYSTQESYALSRQEFLETCELVQDRFRGPAELNIYPVRDKLGTYVLISPSGTVFTTKNPEHGIFPSAGNITVHHLSDLVDQLPFEKNKHRKRYGIAVAKGGAMPNPDVL